LIGTRRVVCERGESELKPTLFRKRPPPEEEPLFPYVYMRESDGDSPTAPKSNSGVVSLSPRLLPSARRTRLPICIRGAASLRWGLRAPSLLST
jgi:hypothetical protein